MTEKKTCFIIAPIGEPKSDIRKRSDQVFNHIIKPVVEPLGYKPVRSNHISEPGIITSQVIQNVLDAPLVVADLTDHNPNVFYELAIRHAIKKPLVQIIDKNQRLPFDVAGTRTILIDVHDLDNVEDAKKELESQIRTIERGKTEIDTPISMAVDLSVLKKSESPEKRYVASLVPLMHELRSEIREMIHMNDRVLYEVRHLSHAPSRLSPEEYAFILAKSDLRKQVEKSRRQSLKAKRSLA